MFPGAKGLGSVKSWELLLLGPFVPCVDPLLPGAKCPGGQKSCIHFIFQVSPSTQMGISNSETELNLSTKF